MCTVVRTNINTVMDDLDYDLLTFFLIFEVTAMEFGPCVKLNKQIPVLSLDDLDLLTFFLIFEAITMKFKRCTQF